jgi:hypothetical protein
MKFGGVVGAIQDPASGTIVNPRCFGEATVGDPSLEPMLKTAIVRAIAEHFVEALARGASPATIAAAPDLGIAVASKASAHVGSPVTIEMLNVVFPSD